MQKQFCGYLSVNTTVNQIRERIGGQSDNQTKESNPRIENLRAVDVAPTLLVQVRCRGNAPICGG
jgi:hypothetical protein